MLVHEAGLSAPRRACRSSVTQRACLFLGRPMSRGGPTFLEAGLSVPRRACLSRGGLVCPEAGLTSPLSRSCLGWCCSRGERTTPSPSRSMYSTRADSTPTSVCLHAKCIETRVPALSLTTCKECQARTSTRHPHPPQQTELLLPLAATRLLKQVHHQLALEKCKTPQIFEILWSTPFISKNSCQKFTVLTRSS